MKNKKIVTMAVSLGMTAALGAGATLALLSDQTEKLTNTFTFTDKRIEIALDEAKVDAKTNQAVSPQVRIPEGQTQSYGNLLPGMVVDKDPTVTVKADSLNCNVFVSVKNENVEKNLKITDLNTGAWKEIKASDYGLTPEANTKYYVYQGEKASGQIETSDAFKVVPAADRDLVLEDIFEHLQVGTLKESVTFTDIVIKAAAYQADSAADQDVAKEALTALGCTQA